MTLQRTSRVMSILRLSCDGYGERAGQCEAHLDSDTVRGTVTTGFRRDAVNRGWLELRPSESDARTHYCPSCAKAWVTERYRQAGIPETGAAR